ncbi:MAG: hypothetical protein M1829_002359 [Trizodia sp. TS-e1964]|nr:MAG: hypothetical protein M1829_002359 [Trizodia sp. TS-e1964]
MSTQSPKEERPRSQAETRPPNPRPAIFICRSQPARSPGVEQEQEEEESDRSALLPPMLRLPQTRESHQLHRAAFSQHTGEEQEQEQEQELERSPLLPSPHLLSPHEAETRALLHHLTQSSPPLNALSRRALLVSLRGLLDLRSLMQRIVAYARAHPYEFSLLLAGSAAVAASLVLLPLLGFGALGPVAGSVAAGWQSALGAGAVFSFLQSAGMGGALAAGVVGGVGVVGGAVVGSVVAFRAVGGLEEVRGMLRTVGGVWGAVVGREGR